MDSDQTNTNDNDGSEMTPKQPSPPFRSLDGIRSRPLLPAASASESQPKHSILNASIPPDGLARRRPKPQKSKHSRKKLVLITVLIIVLGGIGAAAFDAWQLYHKVNRLDVGNLTASVDGDENILVAGSTNRCNLSVQNAQWGFCSQGVTGVNSDVIFIVHLNSKKHVASVLSIPRDTFVPNARSGDQAFKIDAALYQGPTQLVRAVEEDFGIPIQHYVEVGFDGFVNIVNAIGGVRMDFPMPVYDSNSHLLVTTAGCKLLNGVEALQVVRARHLQYKSPGVTTNDYNYWPQEPESDIARIVRTHEFIKVLASSILAKGLGNPITDQRLVDAMAPQVQVDSGLSVPTILQFINAFHTIGVNSVPELVLPISLTNFGDYYYDGYDYGDVVFPSQPQDLSAIDQFLGISKNTDPLNDKPYPASSSVKVNVINATGETDQATQITQGLSGLGFDSVGEPGDVAASSYEAQETVVYYANSGTEDQALAVASKLSGPVILSQNAGMVTRGSAVTVQTGTNAAVIGSPQTTTASAASSNSESASSASTTQSNALVPAISASQGLAPWDPRACPKS